MRLRCSDSSMQRGTLRQLQNVINRRNVKNQPKDDFNACEDFFVLVVISHILCVAMKYLNMDSLNSNSSSELIPDDFWLYSAPEREKILHAVVNANIEDVVDISMTFKDDDASDYSNTDHVFEYARELISLGLLYMSYNDAIKEGDGERVMICWKYMLLIFKATGRRNYSIEAFHTLSNYRLLPPRQAHQLVWSQFIIVHGNGIPGHNIPSDLHMEHLNRLCKECIHHLGANKTEKAIIRVSKCMGPIFTIISNFDKEHGCHHTS